jgi:malate synthase
MPTSRSGHVRVLGPATSAAGRVLTPEALDFVATLHRALNPARRRLLAARAERQRALDAGERPDFLAATKGVRDGEWQVAPAPADLEDRRVEITGPVERKMMINALNSGAKVFMADFEDATSPAWENVVEGQANCMDAVRRSLSFTSPEGKEYRLGERTATLVVRPRGWHLDEAHLEIDGEPASASLFDFGLYFFHNAKELIARGSGPYFYLPKLESHLEARLWNEAFVLAQRTLGIPQGTIRATVLIETILAAFEMDEILYELRDHAAGLNAGRWDYIFSMIKKFRNRADFVLPDRASVTMTVPFMRAYARLLVATCHRRGAHAIGGMAAFVPSRKDAEVNERAFAKVREDKLREAGDGYDGTWVAHPDLVPVAQAVFDDKLRDFSGHPRAHQKDVIGEGAGTAAIALLDARVPDGRVTAAGVRNNVDVALQYLEAWLRGFGAVAIHNLMEDTATAEISRAQLWQWVRHATPIAEGGTMTADLYRTVRDEELQRLVRERGATQHRLEEAAALLDELVLGADFAEFLTLPGYRQLVTHDHTPGSGGRMRKENGIEAQESRLREQWDSARDGIRRTYAPADVVRLRGSVQVEHTLAKRGAERLRELMARPGFVRTFGALTGAQAVQMAKAGLEAIYLSGWQVAADGNQAAQTYPDQSIYPVNSVPALVKRLNNAMLRADQIEWSEGTDRNGELILPIVADAEAGFGGPIHAFELTKNMIEAGAAGVHFEDQLASEKKCGHMGGKVLVPTSQFERTLSAARLAADVADVPTVIIARTDAQSATLITSDVDERDRRFMTGERTAEGYFHVKGGLESAIARGLAYAPYADLLWCETSTPDLDEAKRFAEGIRREFPDKLLAYNCSPSFNWSKKLDAATIAKFQDELGAMGYRFQFITLAGWHMINLYSFTLAQAYKAEGMPAYVRLQNEEFAREAEGYTATKHQREAGTGYFDLVLNTVSGGHASTAALHGSTEEEQFHDAPRNGAAAGLEAAAAAQLAALVLGEGTGKATRA